MRRLIGLEHTFIILIAILFSSCASTLEQTKEKAKLESPAYIAQSTAIDTSQIKIQARNYVIKGSNYQMMNKNAEAIIEFQQAARLDSAASIFYAIAKSYKELSKLELAIENINLSLKIDPEFLPAWDLLVELQIMNYDLVAAIKTLENIMRFDASRNRRVTLARLFEFENLDKAIDLYEKLLSEEMEISILQRLTYLYHQNHQEEEYVASLQKLYSLDNQDQSVVIDLLDYYFTNKEYQSANELINEIDKSLPTQDLLVFYSTCADEYWNNQSPEIDKYIKEFLTKIDTRFYFDPYLNYRAGDLSLRLNQVANAERYFNRLQKMSDTSWIFVLPVTYSYFKYKYFAECADISNKYIAQYPDSIQLYILAAQSYQLMGRIGEAIDILNRAILIDDKSIEAHSLLASYYDKANKKDLAFATFEKALRLDKNDALINNNYAYSLAERSENLDKALIMSNIAISSEPGNASYLDTFAWIMYKLERYQTAEQYMLKALAIAETAEMFEHLGDIYFAMNKLDAARIAWTKANELEPSKRLLEKLNKSNGNK